jgi:HPt (histidine-containing phosphotransfer) domain-containing protein
MSIQMEGTAFDRETALSRVDGDVNLLKEIAVLFLGDYPRALGELREAIAQGDATRLERTAHGLKGSVANFGAHAAVQAALAIENMARARKLAGVGPLLDQLEQALAALRPELERL